MKAEDLRVKIFADGASVEAMRELALRPLVKGFTTNPTLMRKAGVEDFERFAKDVVAVAGDRPISLGPLSDDFAEMERQALRLATLGSNVYVKIPITDTAGESSEPLLRRLSAADVKLNVTALMTVRHVEIAAGALQGGTPAFLSFFAGRVADTGRDPVPMLEECVRLVDDAPHLELIWASPREVLNVVQADRIGVHVITLTKDLFAKLPLLGKDLDAFALETVQMFDRDARSIVEKENDPIHADR